MKKQKEKILVRSKRSYKDLTKKEKSDILDYIALRDYNKGDLF